MFKREGPAKGGVRFFIPWRNAHGITIVIFVFAG